MTIARTSASRAASSRARVSPSSMANVMAFRRSGRLRVRSDTCPRFSTRRSAMRLVSHATRGRGNPCDGCRSRRRTLRSARGGRAVRVATGVVARSRQHVDRDGRGVGGARALRRRGGVHAGALSACRGGRAAGAVGVDRGGAAGDAGRARLRAGDPHAPRGAAGRSRRGRAPRPRAHAKRADRAPLVRGSAGRSRGARTLARRGASPRHRQQLGRYGRGRPGRVRVARPRGRRRRFVRLRRREARPADLRARARSRGPGHVERGPRRRLVRGGRARRACRRPSCRPPGPVRRLAGHGMRDRSGPDVDRRAGRRLRMSGGPAAPRWAGEAGFFEIWFVVALERAAARAWWFRYTTFAPRAGEPHGTVWAAAFEAGRPARWGKARVSPDEIHAAVAELARGHATGRVELDDGPVAWDLDVRGGDGVARGPTWLERVPAPTRVAHLRSEADVTGGVRFGDGSAIDVRAVGTVKHLWGTRRVEELY